MSGMIKHCDEHELSSRHNTLSVLKYLGVTSLSVALRRWPLVLILSVLPILSVGLFARGYWTPDEPRELAIAGRMAVQEQKVIPLFAGQPYSEKPPLTYWLAGGCLAAMGKDVRIARIPNLLYALVGIFAIALLAHAMMRGAGANAETAAIAALGAGIAEGTMELTCQVEIWLASDAPLLAGVSLALFGAWRGVNAIPGRTKFNWYLVMHTGLLLGFFSKNAIAWVVPGLALATWIFWERGWRELWRGELWVGFLVQAPFILTWVAAVAAQTDGMHQLHIFFIDNVLGRFLPIASEAGYSQGHQNFPGKYLLELPPYLAPWLFLAMVAVRRAWTACREAGPTRGAWRFAVAIIVPNLLLLSVSTTARGIYLAPVMCGWAVLIGLWCAERLTSPDRSERIALWATLVLLTLMSVIMIPGVVVAAYVTAADISFIWVWLAAGFAALGLAFLVPWAWRSARNATFVHALWISLAGLSLSAVSVGTVGMAIANHWQDLSPVAQAAQAAGDELVLFHPDETIIGILDWHCGITPPALQSDQALERCLASDAHAKVLFKMPSRESDYRKFTDELHSHFGLSPEHVIDIAYGRRYAIFGTLAHP